MNPLTTVTLRSSLAAASVLALAGAFYGCSGDDNKTTSTNDAGPTSDSSVPDHTSPDAGDSGSSTTDSSTDAGTDGSPAADGGADAGDAGGIALKVTEVKLFADMSDAGAAHVDPNLVNAWGLALSPNGIAWVSENGSGQTETFTPVSTDAGLTVTIPLPDAGQSSPSGQVFNSTSSNFMGDLFIFATEDGVISGWQRGDAASPASSASVRVDNSASGAVYKGVAIVPSTSPVLIAADFHNNKIDAFDTSYTPIVSDGGAAWSHPNLPTGYAPFNVAVLNSNVYVSYAVQNSQKHDDLSAVGHGIIGVFDTAGTFQKDLVTGGVLNSPWGLALAPSTWGGLAGKLLVGNFGDGFINAYDPTSGAWVGDLVDSTGAQLSIDGLWALVPGANNPDAGESNAQVFFTAGPNMESDGLFGYLTAP